MDPAPPCRRLLPQTNLTSLQTCACCAALRERRAAASDGTSHAAALRLAAISRSLNTPSHDVTATGCRTERPVAVRRKRNQATSRGGIDPGVERLPLFLTQQTCG